MADSLSSYVKHLQVHKCRPDRCNTDSHGKHLQKCKYGFPYPLQNEDGMNKAGNRYLPKRRCPEDKNVVPYNPEILLLWGAHMNIQKVASAGWEMYLAKYVAKTEPSFSINVSKDASEPEKYLRTRIVGQLEVQHIILGHFLCCSSREVIYLPTDLDPEYGFLKRKQHLPQDPDSTDIYYSNYLEKYMDRPAELENVLYEEWASKYTICRTNKPRNDEDEADNDENEPDSENEADKDDESARKQNDSQILQDKAGRKWKKRKVEAIPGWKCFLPNGPFQEQYYMQKNALLISGETLHYFFGMDIYCNTRIEPGTIEYERINRTGIIIIDELPYTTTV